MLREIIPKAALAMAAYDAGAPKRIAHFMKVWGYARTIGQLENLDRRTQLVLELSALTHDIGIKNALEKYGDCSGENGADTEAVRAAKEKIFRTEAGLQLLCSLFPAAQE